MKSEGSVFQSLIESVSKSQSNVHSVLIYDSDNDDLLKIKLSKSRPDAEEASLSQSVGGK